MSETTVLIADDHPLFRAALTQAVEQNLDGVRIHQAENMGQLETLAAEQQDADLVLLDLKMPGARGFSSLVHLRSHHPAIPVIVISAADDTAVIRRAMSFGAAGFLSKSAPLDAIGQAIRNVLAGDTVFPDNTEENQDDNALAAKLESLTPQQFRVLMMLADGLLNKQIAYELKVSEATVKAHMTAIMRKLGIFSRTQAALIAQQLDVDDAALNPADSDQS
ncbi:LuxR family transcriptional regulator [Oceanococcus atlanticus]|uniref:LuxR family transcriptional regulator n=1 Tax=Oceanococcus atlanticus TaxID=1317117 RepID=A0A1Y1SEE6_9GAMM|nr:response regulator transcription factor [Oceanococcus atlanticus]ORE87339.1 LuxR family transcriptional regulator [Oceanococcus atlanticus]RZO87082.1 MAG: response regulator transcription factor [Oceanococcus sp.]